ncbi:unnamed protein product [Mucor hiemalis]
MTVIRLKLKNQLIITFILTTLILSTYIWYRSPILVSDNTSNEHSVQRVKGCFVILIRNNELDGMVDTMTQVENNFNEKYDYPYVFLNNEEFTPAFKRRVQSLTKARVLFGKINNSMWGYPEYINQTYALECRDRMKEQGVAYGDSESYRHMCRFQSGYFFRHPLLDEFEYYWRLEPYVNYYCSIDYDVFKFMKDHKKKYGFTIALKEHIETVPTLWNTVMEFVKTHPQIANKLPQRNDSLIEFVTSDGGKSYNTCHFWSNFEIGDLSLWRSEEYLQLFNYLDRSGGFFYERWGDAPVHSIAAALLLHKNEFHFFNDIGYRHTSYTHCPVEEKYRIKCSCDPNVNFDYEINLSCLPTYQAALKST